MSLELITIAIIRQHTLNDIANDDPMTEEELLASSFGPSKSTMSKSTLFLYDKCSIKDFKSFKGNALEWITIETLIFSMLLATMLFYMIKSRWGKVGMDNSNQFEEMRLSKVVNQIIL